jgi:kynurenine formamidase
MKLVDLSMEISRDLPVHQSFVPPVILDWETHEQSLKRFGSGHSYWAKMIMMIDHVGTHVDAYSHFDPNDPGGSIDTMPLSMFYTPAVCLNFGILPPKTEITKKFLEEACQRDQIQIRPGYTVLLYWGHYERTRGTPAYLTDYPGLMREGVEWLADKKVSLFGVEQPNPGLNDDKAFTVHTVCAERHLPHIENLINLKELVGKGVFRFIAFPLKIKGGTGSPVRAVAVLEE